MSRIDHKFKIWLLLLFSLILVIIVPFFSHLLVELSLWLIFLWVFAIAFLFPNIGIFVIILARPVLDIFGQNSILEVFNIELNSASLFALASIAYGIRLIFSQEKPITPPLSSLWTIFLFITLFSVPFSISTTTSIAEFLRLLSIFSLYLAAYNILDKNNFAAFLKTVVISALIPALVAMYQFFTETGITLPFEGIYNRIYGTFAHPNLLAYYLVLIISIAAFIILLNKEKKFENLLVIFPFVLFFVVFILTYTRGAWLALLIVIGVVGLLRYRALLLFSLLALVFMYIAIPNIHSRVNDLFNPGPDSSITWRQNLWKDAYKYYQERPLLGFGAGTAQGLILDRRGEHMGSSDPHNDYLKIAIENGIVGVFSYTLLILFVPFMIFRSLIKSKQRSLQALSLTLLAISIAFLVLGSVDNIIRNTALMWTWWTVLGGYFALTDKHL